MLIVFPYGSVQRTPALLFLSGYRGESPAWCGPLSLAVEGGLQGTSGSDGGGGWQGAVCVRERAAMARRRRGVTAQPHTQPNYIERVFGV